LNPGVKQKLLGLLAFICVAALAPRSFSQTPSDPANTTRAVAAAAKAFLDTLNPAERAKAVYDFKDGEQRKRWSNLPTSMAKRGGVRLGDLTQIQRAAVQNVLKAALSPQGYEKVIQIVEADEYLNQHSDRKMFGRDEFYVSFLGEPSASDPWMIQFGGHHLAINLTLVGPQGTLAPTHTAAQPAIFQLEGKTIRPLGRETDKSYALFASLDDSQRKQATIGAEMRDLVLGPGHDGQTIQPEGIKGSALTEKQREMLLDLIHEWTGIVQDALAKPKMDELSKNLPETWFAWSGPTQKGGAAYFRIQGPTVVIEYAPQKLGGDPTKHLHTIYRDPTNEYGSKWWQR
jgi:hypothetical protein